MTPEQVLNVLREHRMKLYNQELEHRLCRRKYKKAFAAIVTLFVMLAISAIISFIFQGVR